MIRVTARNTGRALVRVLDHTVISAMSTCTKVTSNSILAVLRCCTMILLTLVASYNTVFLRVDINIVILFIQKNIILYDEINLSRGYKNLNERASFYHVSSGISSLDSLYNVDLTVSLEICRDKSTHFVLLI